MCGGIIVFGFAVLGLILGWPWLLIAAAALKIFIDYLGYASGQLRGCTSVVLFYVLGGVLGYIFLTPRFTPIPAIMGGIALISILEDILGLFVGLLATRRHDRYDEYIT
jgi:hypothetical protein